MTQRVSVVIAKKRFVLAASKRIQVRVPVSGFEIYEVSSDTARSAWTCVAIVFRIHSFTVVR
jgi:hypothetical protein